MSTRPAWSERRWRLLLLPLALVAAFLATTRVTWTGRRAGAPPPGGLGRR